MFNPPAYVGFTNRYTPEFAQVSNATNIPWDAVGVQNPIEAGPVAFTPRCGQFTVRVVLSTGGITVLPIDFFEFDVAGGFSNYIGAPNREFEHVAGTDLGKRMNYVGVATPRPVIDINAGAFTFVSSTLLPSLAKQMDFTYNVTGGGVTTFRFVFPISPSDTVRPTIEAVAGAALPALTDVDVFVLQG